MKAISIRSPWWEKILNGEKTIETRTWKTNHRGDLLICASKPYGKAIAIANLIDCRRMQNNDWKKACCEPYNNAYAWDLINIRPISPFKVIGKLRLFEIKLQEE